MKIIRRLMICAVMLFCLQGFKSNNDFETQTISIEKFGAKGDGKTNNYDALLAAASYINNKKGIILLFPKGNYMITNYSTREKMFKDIIFENCTNLTIKGENTIITLNGAFHRKADYRNGKYVYSRSNAITPFSFLNCNNIKLEGLELNGGVNLMTRDKDVVESKGHLLKFSNCTDVYVRNLNIHHAQTDGIYISGENSRFLMENVTSSNNARQGMSIIQLFEGTFKNCKFLNSGITGGNYGGHAPRAGVDIEPHTSAAYNVKNILFLNCSFINNQGSQFVCTSPTSTADVILDSCTFDAKLSNTRYQLILSADSIVVKNSDIDCGNGNIYPVWNKMPNSHVEILNCKIKSSSNGIVASQKFTTAQLIIKNNELSYTGLNKMQSYFPYLQLTNAVFTNNKIFIPTNALNNRFSSLIQNALESNGNIFYSDHKSIKPKVSYTGTKKVRDN